MQVRVLSPAPSGLAFLHRKYETQTDVWGMTGSNVRLWDVGILINHRPRRVGDPLVLAEGLSRLDGMMVLIQRCQFQPR